MNIPLEARRRGCALGKVTQRRQYVARVEAFCRAELAPLTDRVPMRELLCAVIKIYARAYQTGYQCGCRRRREAAARQGGRHEAEYR